LSGSQGCGKTTIANILTGSYNFSTREYKMTLGVDVFEKRFTMGDRYVDVLLVDTSGHQLYSWLVDRVCDTDGIFVFCFDSTDKQSFDALERIVNNTTVKTGVVVGCKWDLTMRQVIPLDIAEQFAAHNNMQFISASAVSISEISSLFYRI
uniref:Uncharacterized protein n=1 Tax=Parascaris univalens TaxID=6257 RepID=A0A915BAF0_PARUN